MIKARLYAKENNSTAAMLEYEKAYNAIGTFTPYVSYEVLTFSNSILLREKNLPQALENTRQFTREHPTHKDGRIALAQLAFQARETETAFEAINSVLAEDPHHFPARLMLTKVRSLQGRLDLAEEQLRILYGKYPDSTAALLPLAENLLLQGRTAESREFLARVIADHPRNSSARALLLDSYLVERKVDSARAVMDAWKDANPEVALAVQVRKARLYALVDSADRAREALAPFLDKQEANLAAYGELALLHAIRGQYDSAVQVYRQMEDIGPAGRAASHSMSVFLFLKNRNPARALEALKTMQVADRRAGNVNLTLLAYLAIGQEEKAAALIGQQPDSAQAPLRAFLAQYPADKDFIGQWALITYFSANRLEPLALLEARKLHEGWPKSDMARTLYASKLAAARRFRDAAKVLEGLAAPATAQQLSLVNLYAQGGERDKATALARKLLAANPRLPGLNLMLGDFAWGAKDVDAALAAYEKELAITPDNPLALNNLAWEYGATRKDLAKARPYLDRLEKHKRLDPRIMDTIGWILAVNGKAAEAEGYLRPALYLVPDHPAFLYHLAFALNLEGKKDEARRLLGTALSNPKPFDERKDSETLLAELGR